MTEIDRLKAEIAKKSELLEEARKVLGSLLKGVYRNPTESHEYAAKREVVDAGYALFAKLEAK